MYDILHEVIIAGSTEKIYQALTEQAGLKGWWSAYSIAEPKVGSITDVSFYGGQVRFVFSVDTLKPGKQVYWAVKQGVPGWENTRVTWDLTPAENGTKLLLGHRGWVSTDGLYAQVSYNWAWYLISLKAYIETGKGTPFVDAAA